MDFQLVLNQVLVLFILLVIGFVLKKMNMLSDQLGKGLSHLLINVTLPALIVTSMNYEFSQDMLNNSVNLLIIGFFVYGFMIILAYIFAKIFHIKEPQRGVYLFMIIFSNVGFMGYPVAEVMFGKIGVFYTAMFNLWFNILIWTLGVIIINPNHDKKINIKTLMNPGIVSTLLGFLLFIFSIKIPQPLFISLHDLGKTTTPLAMIIVGAMLGDAKVKDVFTNTTLILSSLLRLIVIPLTVLLVLSRFNLNPIVKGIPVIVSGMPAAANAAIFARNYDSDYKLASQGVFLTTMLSVITIPLLIFLIMKI